MELTQEKLKELLTYEPETGLFRWNVTRGGAKKHEVAGAIHPPNYIRICVCRKAYLAHRLAWFYVYGAWPVEVDHINQIKNDNRITNLREVTRSENLQNRGILSSNSSGRKGVSLDAKSGKWKAQIQINGVNKSLGFYSTIESADIAYQRAAEKLHTHRPLEGVNNDAI